LASRLVALGHEVRILDNFATGRRSNMLALGGEAELVEGDIQSYERVHNAVTGCEVVFHQAALPSVPRGPGPVDQQCDQCHRDPQCAAGQP
jgi:UDP-glucose 4-epimerase